MFEKAKRCIKWFNYDIDLGKLWGLNLIVFATLCLFAVIFHNEHTGLGGALVGITLLIFLPLYFVTLIVTFVRIKRSERAMNILLSIAGCALLLWFTYSLVTHPAETVEFFKNSWTSYWTDPFHQMIWTIFGYTWLAIVGVGILGAIAIRVVVAILRRRKKP